MTRRFEIDRIWNIGIIAHVDAGKIRGVEPLLDAVVTLLAVAARSRGHGGALAALGFKVVFDDHGQLTFVRVYRGALEKGMTVLAARAGRKLRVGARCPGGGR